MKEWNTDMSQAPTDKIIEVYGHTDINSRRKVKAFARWNHDFSLWATSTGNVIFPDKWRFKS